jgi:hypothetical protein
LLLFSAAVALVACYLGSTLPSGGGTSPLASVSGGFPKEGVYDIVHDRPDGRSETNMWIHASTRPDFEDLVARPDGNCRDRSVSIGGGSFSVGMICDAPDGDIRNIPITRRGSYSTDSIDMESETNLWASLSGRQAAIPCARRTGETLDVTWLSMIGAVHSGRPAGASAFHPKQT